MTPNLERYSRQILYEPVGLEGQNRIRRARVALIGCGALGSSSANLLARAGIGSLRIIDRDYVELNNLQRQVLFDEQDVADNLPKAEAARRKLSRINSEVAVEAIIADANPRNIESLTQDSDLILDGTDNFSTRFLINDVCVKHRMPWIYGACVAATGLALPILPFEGPCLRCVFEQSPPPELNPTCDTVGILAPIAHFISSHQVMEALKLLAGRKEAMNRRLLHMDAWNNRISQIHVENAGRESDCPCCKHGRFEFLAGEASGNAVTLCGRDAVQVCPTSGIQIDLARIAAKLKAVASEPPAGNEYLLRARIHPYELTIFKDGRAIIKGTKRPEEARSLYDRYIGS